MPKKQSATSVKHQDLEKKKEEYKKEGIRIFKYKKIANPSSYDAYKVYKKLDPQPRNDLEVEIAKWSMKRHQNIKFEVWDISRRDEPPNSRKAYIFIGTILNMDDSDRIKNEIELAEEKYVHKIKELKRKIEETESLTNQERKTPPIIDILSGC